MKVNVLNNNIIHFIGNNQYELASSFVRLQEFYESPKDNIRGKYFTLEYFMDEYALDHDNKFTYFQDWEGFNIPGNIVLSFFEKLNNDLRPKEKFILELLTKYIDNNDANFYVIGSIDDHLITLRHEYAHALYYLNEDYRCYREYMLEETSDELKTYLYDKLAKKGYYQNMFNDEIQAYFSTASLTDLIKVFNFTEDNFPLLTIAHYQNMFEDVPKLEITSLLV